VSVFEEKQLRASIEALSFGDHSHGDTLEAWILSAHQVLERTRWVLLSRGLLNCKLRASDKSLHDLPTHVIRSIARPRANAYEIFSNRCPADLCSRLQTVWGRVPSRLVVIPIRLPSVDCFAILDCAIPAGTPDFVRLMCALFWSAERFHSIGPERLKQLESWSAHPTPTLSVDLDTGVFRANPGSLNLLEASDSELRLEKVLGKGCIEALQARTREFQSLGKIDVEFSHKKNDNVTRIRLMASISDSILVLSLWGVKAPASEQETDAETLIWLGGDSLEPLRIGASDRLVTIGRHEKNNLVLPDAGVSRFHATVKVQGSRVMIEDLGSANGISVNGTRVSKKVLLSGDRIQIGPFELFARSTRPTGRQRFPQTRRSSRVRLTPPPTP